MSTEADRQRIADGRALGFIQPDDPTEFEEAIMDTAPLGYMTECIHRISSTITCGCQHGQLTGTLRHPPTGRIFPGVPIQGPVNKTESDE